MGRNFAVDGLPHYREVLVANAMTTVRDILPAVEAFAAGRRAWMIQAAERAEWHAVAIAAGAASNPAVNR